jgi:hypothetical protein
MPPRPRNIPGSDDAMRRQVMTTRLSQSANFLGRVVAVASGVAQPPSLRSAANESTQTCLPQSRRSPNHPPHRQHDVHTTDVNDVRRERSLLHPQNAARLRHRERRRSNRRSASLSGRSSREHGCVKRASYYLGKLWKSAYSIPVVCGKARKCPEPLPPALPPRRPRPSQIKVSCGLAITKCSAECGHRHACCRYGEFVSIGLPLRVLRSPAPLLSCLPANQTLSSQAHSDRRVV